MTTILTDFERTPAGKRTSRRSVAKVVASLRGSLGDALTAQIAGVPDPAMIEAWVSGRAKPEPDVADRLRAALGIAELLLEVETPAIVRAWFGGRNRMLGDRPPGLVIRSEPDAVLRAARAFRAYG